MSKYLGDYAEDATVYVPFTTSNGSGAAVAPLSAFEAADVVIYKNGSTAQKTSTNGVTMTSPFDSVVGLHWVAIDTSNDTGDSGFWVAGADYTVVLSPDTETVDGQAVVSVLAQFSIENRGPAALRRSARSVISGTVNASPAPTTTALTGAVSVVPSVTDQLKGRVLIFAADTITTALRGQATDITASTAPGSGNAGLTYTQLTSAPQTGDTFVIV